MNNNQIILMLLAYLYGCNASVDDITDIAKKLMSEWDARQALSRLHSKNLIAQSRMGYYYNTYYKLKRGQLFTNLHDLLLPQNLNILREIEKAAHKKRKLGAPTKAVLYAMHMLDPDRNIGINTVNYPSSDDFNYEVGTILTDNNYRNAFAGLTDGALKACLEYRLEEVLVNDELIDWEYLDALIIDDRADRRKSTSTAGMQTAFNFYYYLATGKMCIDLESMPADEYSLQTAAIAHMYKGDYDNACKLYAKAITAHNKGNKEKGVFSNIVSNYLYALCLLLTDGETTSGKLEALTKKAPVKNEQESNMLIVPLYNYFCQHKSTSINAQNLNAIFRQSEKQSPLWLTWMLYNRLGIWPRTTTAPSLTTHTPHQAWLCNELMPTGMIPANDEAAKRLGGSLLYRLKVKAVWEMRLEEIIKENATTGEGKEERRSSRLIYLIEYNMIVPLLQKRRKDGQWSVGRRLTAGQLKRLTNSDVRLDDADQRLMQNVSDWDYNIFESSNIADLAGCDHVYTGEQTDLIPVSVHEDKPFLIINRDKDGSFSISTNVQELATDNSKSTFYKKNSDTDYSVYHPTAMERKVYKEILLQETYPKEAEPLLLKLIATLGGKTEIHSNMVVDLDDLEKVDGLTKLTLRCVPDHYDTYNISVSVHAFPGLNFVPGEGNITTIAEKDGKKVQVVRKMREERKNMKQLAMKLADLGAIDEDDWQPQTTTETVTLGLGMFLDLMQWVKDNPDACEMEWPEGARVKYHPAVKSTAASIGFKSRNGWFEVEGDVRIDEDQIISLQQLLEMMHAAGKNRYIKIGENEYITLSSDLGKILKRLDTVTTERRNHLQMSNAAVSLIGDVLDSSTANITHSKAMDALRQRIADSTNIQPQVPSGLHARLRDYQEEGYDWMERVTSWGAGACLADDMGLGKTLQTIAMLLDKESDGASLVVAPASVVPNWRNELQRFAPSLRVTVLNDAEDRAEAIEKAQEGDIVVATYALLNLQQKQLAEKEWNIVCLDEAHTIKNPNTKMSKAAMTLQAKRKVILTGTPIQNHLSELWNLFQFINPGLLGSSEQFGKKFIEPIEVKHDRERQNQLRRLISPFLLRRTKGEVIEELPEKDEITIPVELSSDEMAMYEVRRRQAENAVLADKTVKMSTLAEITRLRQMACSVSLVDKKWKTPSSKVLAFIDLAESLNDSGNRALVFSQFTSFFEQIRKAMDKAKLPYLYLDGSTPMAQREKLVKDFQNGSCPFFLISLKAGGLGLNLTGANYVIHLDPWWNPAIEQQATDRAYRIGQKQDVTVYHLISQHTIEEKIQRLHKTKRDLADSLLEGTDMSHALTQEELLELLS